MSEDRFGDSELIDYVAGRSKRPPGTTPILELICYEPRPAFAALFVNSLWQDFVQASRVDLSLGYVLSGCMIVGLKVHADDDAMIRVRSEIARGDYDALIGKYQIFTARFVRFPPIIWAESTEFGNSASDELRFDLARVRNQA